MSGRITLKNGRTEIQLNEQGSIVSVTDVKTGHRYFEASSCTARLFHLTIQASGWITPIASHDAPPPTIVDTPDGKVLVYKNLSADGMSGGIDVEVHFAMSAADEIRMSMRVHNHSDNAIVGATFPWINGWRSPGEPTEDRVILGAGASSIKPSALLDWQKPAWGNGIGEEFTLEYPILSAAPWIDVSGQKGGISCINYQRTSRICYSTLKNMADFHPSECIPGILWGFYPYVVPGQSWDAPDVGVSVHDGDWHETADRYRIWTETWLTPAKSKPAFQESIGSLHTYFTDFTGTKYHSPDEIPAIAADARNYGVNELCVWDKITLGTYCPYPGRTKRSDVLKYPPQEKQKLKDGIRKAVEEGSDVSALINFRLISPMLDVYKENQYENDVTQLLFGDDLQEAYIITSTPGKFLMGLWDNYLGGTSKVFTPFSKKYRERVLQIFEEYLDFGYTSLFYDQPFERLPDYSRKDSGCAPECVQAALIDLMAEVRSELQKKHPDAVIMGEQCDVLATSVIDQWMSWFWSDHPSGMDTLTKLRYSLPHTVFNYVLSIDSNQPEVCLGRASHAFAMGLHFFLVVDALHATLAEVPCVGEHIRKLAALRKHCAARIVHARFCDNRGITVTTSDGLVAYSYDSPQGPAVVLAAAEKSGDAEVQLTREFFSCKCSGSGGTVCDMNLNVREVAGDLQTFHLEQNEVVVWMA